MTGTSTRGPGRDPGSGPVSGPDSGSSAHEWLFVRVRIAASSGGVGSLLGAAGVLGVLQATGNLAFASEQVFALGALVHGFAVTGWGASVILGPTLERVGRDGVPEIGTDWTEASSRRAMAHLAAVGGGTMVGVTATTLLLWIGFGVELG